MSSDAVGEALARAIAEVREALGDPAAAVALLVPTEANGVGCRRSLVRAEEAFFNVHVFSPAELVRRLAGERLAGDGLRPGGASWLRIELAAVLRELPGALEPRGWASPVAAAVETLEAAGVEDVEHPLLSAALAHVAAARAEECVAGPRERHAAAAAAIADALPCNRIAGFVALGDRALSSGAYEVVAAWCAARTGVRVVVPPELPPEPGGLAEAAGECAVVAVEREGLAGRLFGEGPACDGDVAIISAADEVREASEAVREILRAIDEGVALDRIAVALPTTDGADALREAFVAAELPTTWLVGPPLARTPCARFLVQALELAAGGTIRGWYDFLRHPELRLRARKGPGAVAGRGRWRRILARCGATVGTGRILGAIEAWHAAAEEEDEEDRTAAGALLLSLRTLSRALGGLPLEGRVAEHAASWRGFLRDWWPGGPERQRVERLLESWCDDTGGRTIARDAAVRALEERLATTQWTEGQMTDRAVLVAPPGALLGGSFDRVLVLGLAQGRMPREVREDPLLSDALCEALGMAGSERIAREDRRRFAAAVGACDGRLWLSYPRTEMMRGRPATPGSLLLEVGAALAGRPVGYRALAERVERIPGRARPAPDDPAEAVGALEHHLSRLRRGDGLEALCANPHARRLLGLHRAVDEGAAEVVSVPPEVLGVNADEPRSPQALADALLAPGRFFFRWMLDAWPAIALPEEWSPTEREAHRALVREALERALAETGPLRARFERAWDALLEERLAHQPEVAGGVLATARALALDRLDDTLARWPALESAARAEFEEAEVEGLPWTVGAWDGWTAGAALVELRDAAPSRKGLKFADAPASVIAALALEAERVEVGAVEGKLGAGELVELAEVLRDRAARADARMAQGWWPTTEETALTLEREVALELDAIDGVSG